MDGWIDGWLDGWMDGWKWPLDCRSLALASVLAACLAFCLFASARSFCQIIIIIAGHCSFVIFVFFCGLRGRELFLASSGNCLVMALIT